jgi:hypothetical protein
MARWSESQRLATAAPSSSCPSCRGTNTVTAVSAAASRVAPPPPAAQRTPPPAEAPSPPPQRWRLRAVQPAVATPITPLVNSHAPCRLASSPGDVYAVCFDASVGAPLALALAADGAALRAAAPLRHAPPLPLFACATAALGDTLFLFGGVARADLELRSPRSDVLFAIDGLASDLSRDIRITRVAAPSVSGGGAPAPQGRIGAAAVAHGGSLFIIGGAAVPPRGWSASDGANAAHAGLWDCWRYTPRDVRRPGDGGGELTQLPLSGAAPSGRPGLWSAATVLLPARGEALLLGGQSNAGYSADVFALHLATGVVRCLAPPPLAMSSSSRPSARACAAAALLPDGHTVLYAGGGTGDADAADAWLFDADTHAWTRVNTDDDIRDDDDDDDASDDDDDDDAPRIALRQDMLLYTAPCGDSEEEERGGVARVVTWGGGGATMATRSSAFSSLMRVLLLEADAR